MYELLVHFVHRVYLCVSYDFYNKHLTIFLNSINHLVLVMEKWCVYCHVGTEFLNKI
jgi:hypothetical protein